MHKPGSGTPTADLVEHHSHRRGTFTTPRFYFLSLFVLSLSLASLELPVRAQNTSWATPGKYIQYTTSLTVQGFSIGNIPSGNYNTSLTVLSSSGNSVDVRLTTSTSTSFSPSSTTATVYLDKPFSSAQVQFGLSFPLYCPPANISSCSSLVGFGYLSSAFGSISSATPQTSVSDSNTETVYGTIKTSTLSVSESWSYSPTGQYTINIQASTAYSYDSVLGLLTAGSSSFSYQASYGGQSVSESAGSSTKMASTNINNWTPGSKGGGGISIPWFLWGIIAAIAVVAVVAVLAFSRRRGRRVAQPVGSTTPMTSGPTGQAGPVFCGHCGAQMDSNTAFCGKCGASMA